MTDVTGQAIDAPISNATITLTLNAPFGQSGAQTLGTTTADSNGNFTINVTFPNSSSPVFANAQGGTTLLSSYLGPANTLASLSTNNVPNLAISQVTTAALTILAATNSLGTLTPSGYAALLSAHRSNIIAAADGESWPSLTPDAQCPRGHRHLRHGQADGQRDNRNLPRQFDLDPDPSVVDPRNLLQLDAPEPAPGHFGEPVVGPRSSTWAMWSKMSPGRSRRPVHPSGPSGRYGDQRHDSCIESFLCEHSSFPE